MVEFAGAGDHPLNQVGSARLHNVPRDDRLQPDRVKAMHSRFFAPFKCVGLFEIVYGLLMVLFRILFRSKNIVKHYTKCCKAVYVITKCCIGLYDSAITSFFSWPKHAVHTWRPRARKAEPLPYTAAMSKAGGSEVKRRRVSVALLEAPTLQR